MKTLCGAADEDDTPPGATRGRRYELAPTPEAVTKSISISERRWVLHTTHVEDPWLPRP